MILHLNLIILIINNQLHHLRSESENPFMCNYSDTLMELNNFKDHFKRLILNENKIYFVLKNRIIYSELPFVNQNNKLEIFNFNEKIVKDEKLDYKLIGHYRINDLAGNNFELYSEDDKGLEICYQLIFDRGFITKSRSNDCRLTSIKLEKQKFKNDSNYINWYQESLGSVKAYTELIIIEYFKNLNNKLAGLNIRIIYSVPDSRKVDGLFDDFIEQLDCFVFYLHSNPKNISGPFTNEFKLNIFLFGVNKTESKLYFYWLQTYHENELTKLKEPIKGLEYEIKISRLFNCYTILEHENELKGIYYYNNIFYLFLNRHYFRIKNPYFLEIGLQIDEYEFRNYNNLFNLEFQNQSIKFNISFQLDDQTWVKNLINRSYLVPNSKGDEFRIDMNDKELILVQNLNKLNLVICRQTFEIDNKIFCFDEKFYFEIHNKENKISIDSIFIDYMVEVGWNENQKLKYIFYYSNNVVFVTEDYVYLFDYKIFKIDKNNLIEIIFNENYKIVKYENHLFDNLVKARSTESTKIKLPTTESIKNEPITIKSTTIESTKNESTNATKPDIDDLDQLIKYILIGLSIFILLIAPCCVTYLRMNDRINSSNLLNTIRNRSPFDSQLNSSASMVYDTGDNEIQTNYTIPSYVFQHKKSEKRLTSHLSANESPNKSSKQKRKYKSFKR